MKKVIAFAGSNSSKSINKALVTYAAQQLEKASVEILDLNDYDMPIYSFDLEQEHGIPESAIKFLEKIQQSDGIMLSLAENNGAYSAVFKNIFDWMSRQEFKVFADKPMLLMATSSGAHGGATVLELAKGRFPYHGAQVSAHFALPSFQDNFDQGRVINEDLDKKLKLAVREFESQLFKKQLEHAD